MLAHDARSSASPSVSRWLIRTVAGIRRFNATCRAAMVMASCHRIQPSVASTRSWFDSSGGSQLRSFAIAIHSAPRFAGPDFTMVVGIVIQITFLDIGGIPGLPRSDMLLGGWSHFIRRRYRGWIRNCGIFCTRVLISFWCFDFTRRRAICAAPLEIFHGRRFHSRFSGHPENQLHCEERQVDMLHYYYY